MLIKHLFNQHVSYELCLGGRKIIAIYEKTDDYNMCVW